MEETESDHSPNLSILSDDPPGIDDTANAFMIDTQGTSPEVKSIAPRYQVGRKVRF